MTKKDKKDQFTKTVKVNAKIAQKKAKNAYKRTAEVIKKELPVCQTSISNKLKAAGKKKDELLKSAKKQKDELLWKVNNRKKKLSGIDYSKYFRNSPNDCYKVYPSENKDEICNFFLQLSRHKEFHRVAVLQNLYKNNIELEYDIPIIILADIIDHNLGSVPNDIKNIYYSAIFKSENTANNYPGLKKLQYLNILKSGNYDPEESPELLKQFIINCTDTKENQQEAKEILSKYKKILQNIDSPICKTFIYCPRFFLFYLDSIKKNKEEAKEILCAFFVLMNGGKFIGAYQEIVQFEDLILKDKELNDTFIWFLQEEVDLIHRDIRYLKHSPFLMKNIIMHTPHFSWIAHGLSNYSTEIINMAIKKAGDEGKNYEPFIKDIYHDQQKTSLKIKEKNGKPVYTIEISVDTNNPAEGYPLSFSQKKTLSISTLRVFSLFILLHLFNKEVL